MERIFSLSHVTTETNFKGIMKDRAFAPSVIGSKTVQWLGKGVYFWDNCDTEALSLGRVLATNKRLKEDEKIRLISLNFGLDESNYIDLDFKKWNENFYNYLVTSSDGKKVLNILEKIKKNGRKFDTKYQNMVYGLFGRLVDMFVDEVKSHGIDVKLISYSFYTGKPYKKIASVGRINKQFCLKDLSVINGRIKEWKTDELREDM